VEKFAMPTSVRPRRSVLYVPGDNARALDKARGLAADTFIFDLEDGVAPAHKEGARKQVLQALAKGGYGRREKIVRVNALDTEWGRDDLVAVAKSGVDGVLLPKVESAKGVHEAEAILDKAGAPKPLAVWCMVETPRGVLRAEAIANASARVGCLVAGTSDLAADLHADPADDRVALIPALAQIVLAARAADLACLDGVFLDLEDGKGFERECRQGALLGFDGKTLIHPKTIDTANRLFAPSEAAIERARRVVAAHGEALSAGKSLVLLDGKLVEQLHVSAAERMLDLAGQIALLIEEAGFST
jgi:citrate lyase subunit beta/citryl-CoA lyase